MRSATASAPSVWIWTATFASGSEYDLPVSARADPVTASAVRARRREMRLRLSW
jgi:hypothetical protein